MAADTKRGAVRWGHEVRWGMLTSTDTNIGDLDDLKRWLAAQGLYVVTAAEKAVLDTTKAWRKDTIEVFKNKDASDHYGGHVGSPLEAMLAPSFRAELTRREAAK